MFGGGFEFLKCDAVTRPQYPPRKAVGSHGQGHRAGGQAAGWAPGLGQFGPSRGVPGHS